MEQYDWYWNKTKEFDLSSCEAEHEPSGERYTDQQLAAVKVAGHTISDLGDLYTLCAEVEGYYAERNQNPGKAQIPAAKGMLIICPDFPRAKVVRANIALSDRSRKEYKSGVRFSDGDYRVGKDIKPGRYFVPDGDGCYWARLDRRGNIIANSFVNASTRVEVTIRSSDYTFSSENCGEWRRA